MEYYLLSVLFLATLYYLSFIFRSWLRHDAKGARLPPGNTGWPLIGETIDYLLTAKRGVPEKFIEDRRNKYSSNVFRTSLLGETMVMLCTAEGNKFLFSNENKLVQSWWPSTFEKIFSNTEKTTTTEETIRFRKVLAPFLKPDALQNYIGIMDTVTKQFLQEHWHGSETIMFHHLAKKYTLELACQIFLHIEDPQRLAKFQRSMQIISSDTSSQHKQDIMSQLLQETCCDGQYLTESDIANKLFGLLIGAYDNISTTLVSIIKYLSELPEVYDNVLREQMDIAKSKEPGEPLNWGDLNKMKYSWNVVCEVLRLLPPNLGTFRAAICKFTYEGFQIHKGFKFHWNVFATHKNPGYFPNPEKFDPSRFEGNGPVPFSYIPFGGGPRMCPGNEYTRLKVLVFIHNVITEFKWEKVFPDEKIVYDPILIPVKGLPIRLFCHKL
ncbi:Cytochrome P450 [Quillaja saponaria]|uniref:Cytochrome P450 n=1 Tax=Quillaja saponaria TaxID=32244 RepID=A0AAD7PIX9_QUISA|nr:Cytochrome P450 [Quillaja saponaria]